jgi:hypothetical protein
VNVDALENAAEGQVGDLPHFGHGGKTAEMPGEDTSVNAARLEARATWAAPLRLVRS